MNLEDNYDRWKLHEAEKEEALLKCPVCCECDNPIQDEHCYEIDGEYICEECMDRNHRKWVEDLVE